MNANAALQAAENIKPVGSKTNRTRSNSAFDHSDEKKAPPLGLRRVLTQAGRDLYGTKDVQDAITASYVWLADQIGHLALGLIPTLLIGWLFSWAWVRWIVPGWHLPDAWRGAGLFIAGLLIFAYWIKKEIQDFHDTAIRAEGSPFSFDGSDIWWNVKTALFYFACGGLLAAAAFTEWWLMLVVLALLLYPTGRIAFWWLRRKLAFQQAGLPYLFRLANFNHKIGGGVTIPELETFACTRSQSVHFRDVLFGKDRIDIPETSIKHILLSGPLGAGKTSLAVGIGTEFAFSLGIGRYLTASKLVQSLADTATVPDEIKMVDGQMLWPLRWCELLIVDDLDAGLSTTQGAYEHLVDPDRFGVVMGLGAPVPPLAWLTDKRSVWVIGDSRLAERWRDTVAKLLGVPIEQVVLVNVAAK